MNVGCRSTHGSQSVEHAPETVVGIIVEPPRILPWGPCRAAVLGRVLSKLLQPCPTRQAVTGNNAVSLFILLLAPVVILTAMCPAVFQAGRRASKRPPARQSFALPTMGFPVILASFRTSDYPSGPLA